MSRASIILLIVVVVVIGGAFYLANMNTEVAPTTIEKAVVLNAAATQ